MLPNFLARGTVEWYNRSLSLSYSQSISFVVGAGLCTHFIFKRTETHEPLHLVILLLAIPNVLSILLVQHTSSLLSATITTLSWFWMTLATSIVLYRLSPWHPLAEFPGPVICRVSKLWFAFLALRGKQHTYIYELHQKYGDYVRVGPNELSIVDADAIQPLMGPNGLAKGPFWDGRIPERDTVRPMITLRDKIDHTRRRRPWTRAFSTVALKGYEVLVTNRCVQLGETLKLQKGVVDLTKWISYFTYDLMNDLAFGGGSEMMRDGDVNGLWHLLEAGQRTAIFMGHVPWLGMLMMRAPSFPKDLMAFRNHAKTQALTRKKRGSPHEDLFFHLIDEGGVSSTPPSVVEAVSDAGLAIIAGSDTTSSAITNLFYLLITHPEKYKRLRAEIDGVGDEVMDYGKQGRLSYLNGALNESLRLYPPVLGGSQRFIEPGSGGKVVGDRFLPEGTAASIHSYTIQRDPRYFSPLPNSFIPERWLMREERVKLEPGVFQNEDDVRLNSNCFIPFSVGPYNCVGKNLAWMEMRMLVCLLIRRFDMTLADGFRPERWDDEISDYFVMLKGELPVLLTHRDPL